MSFSVADCTIFARSLTFSAEPGTTLDIVDRFMQDESVFLRVRHPQTYAAERFSLSQAFTVDGGEKYVVLSSFNSASEEQTFVIFALLNKDQIVTLSPDQFRELSALLEGSEVEDDYHKISDYLGEIEDRSETLPEFQEYMHTALTAEIAFDTELLKPDLLIAIDRIWQHFGTIFMDLRQINREMWHTFRLVWIIEITGEAFVLVAYTEDVTAESDVVPRIALRIIDSNTLMVLSEQELDKVRMRLTDTIAARNAIKPDEASRYIGFIESP
jgi:hypothetical protein